MWRSLMMLGLNIGRNASDYSDGGRLPLFAERG